jgi:aminoglycoside phosphotransferase family enzyme/predicted kinase
MEALMSVEQQARLVKALKEQKPFPPPGDDVQLLETHISSVLLAGDYAYKIKKPLDFGFLNFLALDDRKHFCEEEIRLNRRLAPQIYLEAIPITGSIEHPRLDGEGDVIEYAVKMRRFDQDQLLDKVLAAGKLSNDIIDSIADIVADFHARAAVAGDDTALGSAESVYAPVAQNFEQIRPLLQDDEQLDQLDRLEAWSEAEYLKLQPLLQQRKADGFIRECHGDMHLGNITLVDGEVVIFDGIEFNDEFRWIDVISEMAFLTMDLTDRGQPGMAQRLMNRYLENTGDYEGLQLLRFYQVYRALVRAKIAGFRLAQELSDDERQSVTAAYQSYSDLAEAFTRESSPAIVLMRGVSASGKSWLGQRLLERLGAFRIRSDRERKRLFADQAATTGVLNAGLYSRDLTVKTYQRLLELTKLITAAGYPIIVDATFLRQEQIAPFDRYANEAGLPLTIVTTTAEKSVLEERLRQRAEEADNISDADLEVLNHQLDHIEPVPQGIRAIEVDTSGDVDADTVAQTISQVK